MKLFLSLLLGAAPPAPPAAPAPLGAPARICILRPADMYTYVMNVSIDGKPVGTLEAGDVLRVDHPAAAEGTTYVDVQVSNLSNVTTLYAHAGGTHIYSIVERPYETSGAAVILDLVDERTDTAAVKRCADAKPRPLP